MGNVMSSLDAARHAYEQGQRDALDAAVQRVEALICSDCLQHLRIGDVWATCLFCDDAWEALLAIKAGQS